MIMIVINMILEVIIILTRKPLRSSKRNFTSFAKVRWLERPTTTTTTTTATMNNTNRSNGHNYY